MRKIPVFAALGFVFFNLLACENAWKSPVKQTNSNESTTASSPTVSVPTQTNFNPENLLAYQKAKIDEQLALINSLKISLKDVYPRVSVDFIKNSPRPFSLIENAANVEWEEFDAATTEYIGNVEEILVNDYTRIDTNKIEALVLMAKKTWPILSQQLRADFSEYNKTQAKIFILDLHISTLHTFLRNKKIDIRHDKFDILFSPAETPLVVGQPFYVDLNLVGLSSQAKFKIVVNGKPTKINPNNISTYTFTPNNTDPQKLEVAATLENPLTGKILTVKKTYNYQPVVAE